MLSCGILAVVVQIIIITTKESNMYRKITDEITDEQFFDLLRRRVLLPCVGQENAVELDNEGYLVVQVEGIKDFDGYYTVDFCAV